LVEHGNNSFWLGTKGGGLIKFDLQSDSQGNIIKYSLQTITGKDGSSGNIEYAENLVLDSRGILWITSSKGLSKFNSASRKFTHYDVSYGLPSHQMSVLQSYSPPFKSDDGTLYFPTGKGPLIFHPDSLTENTDPPEIIFTDLKIFNQSVNIWDSTQQILSKQINYTERFTLKHWQNDFSIEFAALNYKRSSKNQYAYYLENYDDSWRYVLTERQATYTNLDPGDYIFKVKAANDDGVWNEAGISLAITVLPPFWMTWWAYTIYSIMVVGILFILRKNIIRRERLKSDLRVEKMELAKMKEVDEMKSRFFANISHEFRTPLTLILGPVKNLLAMIKTEHEHSALQLVLRNAHRLKELVNQLLDLSQMESGKMRLQVVKNDIYQFMRIVSAPFYSLGQSREVDFVAEIPEEKLGAYFDQDKIEKIVNNLLSNAIKFTGSRGEVLLKADTFYRDQTQFVKISVSDTGPGIPQILQEKIFERFYQVDSSQTKSYEGSGIGLALTKELVELHGGTIDLQSEEGKGSRFTVFIPAERKAYSEKDILSDAPEYVMQSVESDLDHLLESPEKKVQTKMDENQEILLVVDDHQDIRKYIRQNLGDEFSIMEAENGKEGLKIALQVIPDLVLSDIMMPEMDGTEFCRRLKEDTKTSHVPVILLTAKGSGDDKIEGLKTGADDYIIKPFEIEELKVRIKNLIEQRRNLRKKFKQEAILKVKDTEETSMDEKFLIKLVEVVELHMDDEYFTVDQLGREVAMSRSQVHRKLKALTGQSASVFINALRLQRAMQMLREHAGTISEIAYQVGFGSPNYFSKSFQKQYGYPPSEVEKRK